MMGMMGLDEGYDDGDDDDDNMALALPSLSCLALACLSLASLGFLCPVLVWVPPPPPFRLQAVPDTDGRYQSWERAYRKSRCDCFAIPVARRSSPVARRSSLVVRLLVAPLPAARLLVARMLVARYSRLLRSLWICSLLSCSLLVCSLLVWSLLVPCLAYSTLLGSLRILHRCFVNPAEATRGVEAYPRYTALRFPPRGGHGAAGAGCG